MRPDFEQTLSRRAFVIATLGSIASAACASKTPERRVAINPTPTNSTTSIGKEIEQPGRYINITIYFPDYEDVTTGRATYSIKPGALKEQERLYDASNASRNQGSGFMIETNIQRVSLNEGRVTFTINVGDPSTNPWDGAITIVSGLNLSDPHVLSVEWSNRCIGSTKLDGVELNQDLKNGTNCQPKKPTKQQNI